MKIVVTGGSGQLGTHVLERLVATRKVKKIVSLDLVPPIVPSARIEWRIADMRDPGLERHLEGADVLVHLAFIVARRASVATMRAVNVEGSQRIFEAAAQHGVARVVHASSVAAYGVGCEHPVPVVESTPCKPTPHFAYADNKYEVERLLDDFEVRHPGIAVVRLRPGILVGRRISHVSEAFLRRRVLPILSDARGPIVWDEDVAEAVLLATMGDARGAFNLVASEPLTGDEVARLAGFRPVRVPRAAVSAVVRAASALSPIAGERRIDGAWLEAAQDDLVVSAEKAKAELGWKPRYPTSADVAIAFGKSVRVSTEPRIALFLSMVSRLSRRAQKHGEMPPEAGTMKLTIHVDVTGPRGADFALTLDHGKLTLKHGVPRPPDSTVTLATETFLDLLAGKLDPATAGMVGKIRVRGEPIAGMVLGGMIAGFRRATGWDGLQGRVARGLAKWFERGGTSS
jgi:nucleoside-diphosphate-sugar epimerase/putative sterol carrier protein